MYWTYKDNEFVRQIFGYMMERGALSSLYCRSSRHGLVKKGENERAPTTAIIISSSCQNKSMQCKADSDTTGAKGNENEWTVGIDTIVWY